MKMKRPHYLTCLGALVLLVGAGAPAEAQQQRPNILIIWGDDIGWFNVSAYNNGVMGTARPTSTGSRRKASPIITANWEADNDNRWTMLIGGGIGKIHRIGKLPANLSPPVFYNVERPDGSPEWQLRFQFAFLFPK